MGQVLSVVQEWLESDRNGPSSISNARDEEMTDDGEPVTGFEEGLDRTDVLVEKGLTVEEYICRGLNVHGGRLRQQAICAYTGWSEATVSRTLTEMEETDLITRVRLGRENVVCLPDAFATRQSLADD